MNQTKFRPGDRVRLDDKGFDWWGYDEGTYHIADDIFQVRECVDDPSDSRL